MMRAAIVTGVSRGLGEALAAALLQANFHVLGVGRAASARLAGDRFSFARCDLADAGAVAAAVDPAFAALAAQAPAAVTLVNNAAVAAPVGRLGTLDAAAIAAAFATNVAAPTVLSDRFLRAFPDDAVERRIVNISSGAAQRAIPGSGAYSMAKAALEMLTAALAAETVAPRFRAITLRPGIFETDMQKFMRSHDEAVFPSVELFRGFKAQGMLKDPAEVAATIVARLIVAPVEHGRTYSYAEL
jgi:hypothetical protein